MTHILIIKRIMIVCLGIGAVFITSCKKLIEIPPNPPSKIAEVQQFADSASTMTAVAGVYTYTGYNGGFTFNNGYLASTTGLSADELTSTNIYSNSERDFYTYSLTPINDYINLLWNMPYKGIYQINAVLKGVTGNRALSQDLQSQLIGEMKVVRAFYYFNLLNLFGAVPLVVTTDYKENARIPRDSVNVVYNQIITDLTDAGKLLKPRYPSNSRFRPNLYTALTLSAKVHLYRKEWQKSYDDASTAIESGVYSLESDLDRVFLDGSSEAIWQIPAIGSYSVTAEANMFIPYSGSIPGYPITPFLLNAFEQDDQRVQKWIGTSIVGTGNQAQTFYYPFKYKSQTPSGSTEDYMIFRLGELYLIRAEAAAQLDNLTVAIKDLDRVRKRAGLLPGTAVTKDEILTAILHERQVELFTEWGNRWFDLKRTGMATAVLGEEKSNWKPERDMLYPVPRAQRQLDDLLSQNFGYN